MNVVKHARYNTQNVSAGVVVIEVRDAEYGIDTSSIMDRLMDSGSG
jgi:hypothetical protein